MPRSPAEFIARYSKYILVLPPLIFFILFLLMPTIIMLLLSFNTGEATVFNPSQATISNFIDVLSRPMVYKIMRDTFGMSLLSALVTLGVAYPISYLLAFKVENPTVQSLVLFGLLVPYWVDWSIRSISWLSILGEGGLVNYILMGLGVIKAPLKELLFTRLTLVIIWVQTNLLFMIFPIYLSMMKIDPDLLNVAKTLGASPWKAFYNVTFKLSLPGVIIGVIFVFVSTLGDYVTPALWAGGLQMLGLTVQNYAWAFRWPLAATYSVIMLAITVALLYILLKIANIKQVFYE
ncbi:MAG: ABC transporter permease [Candidatus Bathyarchaeia archaeon]|nr:ABC transporter permease [Candidatus Bathyarchaeota archaeon]